MFRAVTDIRFGIGTFTSSMRKDYAAYLVKDIKAWTPPGRPAFLHVFLKQRFHAHGDRPARRRGAGSEYVAVRPTSLVALYRQSKG